MESYGQENQLADSTRKGKSMSCSHQARLFRRSMHCTESELARLQLPARLQDSDRTQSTGLLQHTEVIDVDDSLERVVMTPQPTESVYQLSKAPNTSQQTLAEVDENAASRSARFRAGLIEGLRLLHNIVEDTGAVSQQRQQISVRQASATQPRMRTNGTVTLDMAKSRQPRRVSKSFYDLSNSGERLKSWISRLPSSSSSTGSGGTLKASNEHLAPPQSSATMQHSWSGASTPRSAPSYRGQEQDNAKMSQSHQPKQAEMQQSVYDTPVSIPNLDSTGSMRSLRAQQDHQQWMLSWPKQQSRRPKPDFVPPPPPPPQPLHDSSSTINTFVSERSHYMTPTKMDSDDEFNPIQKVHNNTQNNQAPQHKVIRPIAFRPVVPANRTQLPIVAPLQTQHQSHHHPLDQISNALSDGEIEQPGRRHAHFRGHLTHDASPAKSVPGDTPAQNYMNVSTYQNLTDYRWSPSQSRSQRMVSAKGNSASNSSTSDYDIPILAVAPDEQSTSAGRSSSQRPFEQTTDVAAHPRQHSNTLVSNMSHGSQASSGIHVTPSPSDSGVAELETALREKETELQQLRNRMEQNEQVIIRVYQEKEERWHGKLREWSSRLEQSMATEQRLLTQIQQLHDERGLFQDRIENLNSERYGLQRKVHDLEQAYLDLKLQLEHQSRYAYCKSCTKMVDLAVGNQRHQAIPISHARYQRPTPRDHTPTDPQRVPDVPSNHPQMFNEERIRWHTPETPMHEPEPDQVNNLMNAVQRSAARNPDSPSLKKQSTEQLV